MLNHRHRDGLFWPSLFSVPEEEKKKFLKGVLDTPINYTPYWLAAAMLHASFDDPYVGFRSDDPCLYTACEHVALKFILRDSDLAKDILNEDELEKANEVYARKQYNNKLLQKLLGVFLIILNRTKDQNIKNLFAISIIDELQKIQEAEILRSYGDLKKLIEKVAAGVKNNCYFDAEHGRGDFRDKLHDSLNSYILKRYNYDFNATHTDDCRQTSSTLFRFGEDFKETNRLLQLALVDSAEYWSQHTSFGVVAFLNGIAANNDMRHAEKVVTFIMENLKKMPHMLLVLEHGFPLYMSQYDMLVKRLEEQAFRFSFYNCLEGYFDLSAIEAVPLCYPMSPVESNCFEIGQFVWKRFLCEYNYPNDHEAVMQYLDDEIKRFINGDTHQHTDIAVILDSAPFRYQAENVDRRLFTAYHPDCFSFENIWRRVYLKAYAVTLLSDDEEERFSCLQRIFEDLFKTIEKRLGICTAHQLDTAIRDKRFLELKSKLSTFGITPTDEHKSDYIISLLDRDTALIEEAEAFPILEQIGDAIYGLAVAELLFYDPSIDRIKEKFEKYTRAEMQVLISKKHGFDKLYLQVGFPGKYVEYGSLFFNYEIYNTILRNDDVFNDEKLRSLQKGKYYADSLEMIIGAIYRDIGLDTALAFAKKLLLTTFPEQLHEETHPTEENKNNTDIDGDYWERILAAPFSVMESEHNMLWNALSKILLIVSLGTDDKDKRNFITNSLGNTAIYGEEHGSYYVPWVFYYYLRDGLSTVIEKYGDIIRENYKNNKKHY